MVHLGKNDYALLSNKMAKKSRSQLGVMKPCPICGTLLEPGQRVHTVVFSGERDPSPTQSGAGNAGGENQDARKTDGAKPRDALVHMYGCPHCHPANNAHPRICPVCDREVPADGYVVARMFTKEPRNHVHVLGCTACRNPVGGRR